MILGSAILEIVLGLAFLYLLLAIICSTVNEWIAGILKWRANTLREGIANLLEDPEVKGLAQQFFAHPLVKGLTRQGKQNLPSYIPASTFTAALLDIILPTDPNSGPADLLQLYQNIRAKLTGYSSANSSLAKTVLLLLDQAGVDPKKVQEAAVALQQLDQARARLLEFTRQLDASDSEEMQTLAAALNQFKTLETSLRQAETTARAALLRAEENVQHYFDQAMDRVSGWYKRRVQVFICVIATLVCLLLNADSLAIANRLAIDPVLRQAVAATVENSLQQSSTTTAAPGTAPAAEQQVGSAAAALAPGANISTTLALVNNMGLPLGWVETPRGFSGWIYKLLGLLVTIVAVSLGAPFWFELLNKLVSLRMSGKKPVEAAPNSRTGVGSVLEARLVQAPVSGQVEVVARTIPEDQLAELANRAVKYVADLKATRPLAVPERDLAVAWLLVEITDQGLAVAPADMLSALERAFRGRA